MIRLVRPVEPFFERSVSYGMSFGLSHAGYDVRIAQSLNLMPGEFKLASTVERFKMPNNLVGFVHDKSSWARRGLSLFNTVIEPGWEGYLTLELVNHSQRVIGISAEMPIAQIIFMQTAAPVEFPYRGKYQHQETGPQEAREEKS